MLSLTGPTGAEAGLKALRLFLAALLLLTAVVPASLPAQVSDQNGRSMITAVDAALVPQSFKPGLDTLSTGTGAAAILLTGIPLASGYRDSREQGLTVSIAPSFWYAASLSAVYGISELIKSEVGRLRPFPEFDDDPEASFPSRHTALSAAAASFLTVYIRHTELSSTAANLIIASAWTCFAATGALRTASGAHYFSDVLGGALLGCAAGLVGGCLAVRVPSPQ
jgi:membrane-associated phospholipid phosphatase